MHSTLYINVKAYPGSDVVDTAMDMVQLATRFEISVWASFNGVRLCARPGGNYHTLIANYRKALTSKTANKMACS